MKIWQIISNTEESPKSLKNDKNRAKCGFLHSNRLVVGRKSVAQELANADLRTVRGNGSTTVLP
jgi:hypothetical protein